MSTTAAESPIVALPPNAPPVGAPIEPQSPPTLNLYRFSVDEYRRMGELGILRPEDRVELLEGYVVTKMTRNPPHDGALQRLNRFFGRTLPSGWDWRIHSALTLADSEPEPDVAIVRARPDDYTAKHPVASETALVIEVAEMSLRLDQTRKATIYARAGIAEYWIVNLPDQCIEVWTDPQPTHESATYRQQKVFHPGDRIPFALEGAHLADLAVADLLP